jgi:hypothetical protein
MWHNVILPNAIIARKYGNPSTFSDAIEALNYAMSHGKTKRSLAAWDSVCEAERKISGQPESIVCKFRRSFYYYAMGMAANKDGQLYKLPKSKVMSLTAYVQLPAVRKFIYRKIEFWYCPWRDLNMLVDAFKHHQDKYIERLRTLQKTIDNLESSIRHSWNDEAKKDMSMRRDEAQKLFDDLDEPEFPMTQRSIVDTYHVSMTSAARFLHWYRQMIKETEWIPGTSLPSEVSWCGEKPKKVKDFVDDTDDDDDTLMDEADIEHAIQSVVNSGERAIGRWDSNEGNLPF